MKKTFLTLAVFLFLGYSSSIQAAGIEFAIGGWQQNPSGQMNYKTADESNGIDFDDDIDFGDETRVTGRIKVDMPLMVPNIYFLAAPMEFEGTGRKDVEFAFGDTVFSADADLKSKITLNQYDFCLYYGIPALETATAGLLNIDLGLNARYLDLAVELEGESAQPSGAIVIEEKSIKVVIPMIYAAIQVRPIEVFSIEAELRGISIGGNSLFSFIGRLRGNIFGPSFIAGGYRYDVVDVDENDIKVDANSSGPFLEVGIEF
ncbi:MAG: TIGR04219 family outer membrane beta-barrel protein [Desulfobacteraceae bacterium]|nr:TIGR04219 family outer membrane beta-barrel protein [Desulfobacteraceae bacterium]